MDAFRNLDPYSYGSQSPPDDPRLGSLITPYSETAFSSANVVFLGIPTDEGVGRNGGRIGASKAPNAIREFLGKLTPVTSENKSLERLKILDLGNVVGATLEEVHQNATEIVKALSQQDKIIIAIGGGHDITYPLVKGYAAGIAKPIGLINVDAHLDVREKKNGLHHSGSSFRLLLEEGIVVGKHFTEFGIQDFSFSQQHLAWLFERSSRVDFYSDIRSNPTQVFETRLGQLPPTRYVSFDIDAIQASDAPGVSAPATVGFTAQDALSFAELCGNAGVRMIDIVEVNPDYDLDGRTARLAARMIATFLAASISREG